VKIGVVAETGFTRSSINVHLRSAGHVVAEAEPVSLYEVLVVMREVLPHLVILDHDIPQCHCETVVRIMREDPVLARTPILVVVDHLASAEAERLVSWERVRLLEKPLQVEALLQAVQDPFPETSPDSLGQPALA